MKKYQFGLVSLLFTLTLCSVGFSSWMTYSALGPIEIETSIGEIKDMSINFENSDLQNNAMQSKAGLQDYCVDGFINDNGSLTYTGYFCFKKFMYTSVLGGSSTSVNLDYVVSLSDNVDGKITNNTNVTITLNAFVSNTTLSNQITISASNEGRLVAQDLAKENDVYSFSQSNIAATNYYFYLTFKLVVASTYWATFYDALQAGNGSFNVGISTTATVL